MTHPGYNHRNLAAVWCEAGRHSDDMDVGETSSFLRLDPYKRNVVVARWEDALEKFTRWELSRIDACLATLVGKLDGELEAELHSARRLVFELYGDAYDDNKEDYGPWDGRTAPADLQELAEEED